MQSGSHQRVQGPTVLEALHHVLQQTVFRLRPVACVRVLLVLDHQSGRLQLRKQPIGGRQNMSGALPVGVVQDMVDLRRDKAEQPTSVVRCDIGQVADGVDRVVQRRILAMRIAGRQLPRLLAQLASAGAQSMG
ncbi:hypothetical protein FQZ97_756630 [compost metagenome]